MKVHPFNDIYELAHVQRLLATDLRIPLGDAPSPHIPANPERLGWVWTRLSAARPPGSPTRARRSACAGPPGAGGTRPGLRNSRAPALTTAEMGRSADAVARASRGQWQKRRPTDGEHRDRSEGGSS